jgi:signal transduction histidine kinase
VLEDRSRIARDLHDNVIQRLFGAGLSLQALAGQADERLRARIVEQVDALDAAIADIRTAIFTMTSQSDTDQPTLRHRVIDLLGELSEAFTDAPRLAFAGPVDLMVPPDVADDVVAVVREGLANVARHAQAEHAWALVAVLDGTALVEIEDDGRGIAPESTRSSGTANLAARAEARGGTLELAPRHPRGTVLRWRVPLEESE